jgi:hypothetical protein
MFPLEFPLDILHRQAQPDDVVLDPFCGRGTTNYACRLLGIQSFGIDSSPVAVALSQAKLANSSVPAILRAATTILESVTEPRDVPTGEFWDWAFHPAVLDTICRFREGLLANCESASRKALRAIIMGALHGPQPKSAPSYLSNQSPRTYAPKPRYAVNFWRARGLRPPLVKVIDIIRTRAQRYYGSQLSHARGRVVEGDSRDGASYTALGLDRLINWVITSPPYYGMRMYIPDQWLRYWFVGGPPTVSYRADRQLAHSSAEAYVTQLGTVWFNVARQCERGAHLVVRFGAINDRRAEPRSLIERSLADTGWHIVDTRSAGTALSGKRQALHFSGTRKAPIEEYDLWAILA